MPRSRWHRDAHVGGGRGSRRHPQIAVTDGRGGPTCCARITAQSGARLGDQPGWSSKGHGNECSVTSHRLRVRASELAASRPGRPQVAGGSGWGNQELQYYTDEPGNAAHDGAGNLAIVVRRVNPELARRRYGGRGYTSARHLRAIDQQGPAVVPVRIDTGADKDSAGMRDLARLLATRPGHRPVRVASLR